MAATPPCPMLREEAFGNEPLGVADMFAFFAGEWPSAMAWIGAYDESKGAVWPLHSAKYVLDESTLARGAAMHAGYAVAWGRVRDERNPRRRAVNAITRVADERVRRRVREPHGDPPREPRSTWRSLKSRALVGGH